MKTLKLGKDDFKKRKDSYLSDYIGKEDISDFDGYLEIEANLGWVFFQSVKVSGGLGIEAGSGIEAGWGIKAGWGIEAGSGIKAGLGIEAGLGIACKLSLKCSYRIFAGLALWKKEVSDEEKTVSCKRLEGGGKVEYGILKETG
jgi:hypothetical protein